MNLTHSEHHTQQAVINHLTHSLGYSLTASCPQPVNESLLTASLSQRGYSQPDIDRALHALTSAHDSTRVYSLLRLGLQGNKTHRRTVHYIDWDSPERNTFTVSQEVRVKCSDGRRESRLDLVLSVNGIALAVIELKSSCVSIDDGIMQLLTYQHGENIEHFFRTVQLVIAGSESQGVRYGVVGTPAKYFMSWTENPNADDDTSRAVHELQCDNTLLNGLTSLCHPERLLTFVRDFMIFDNGTKKTARHNQFFAVLAAQKRILNHEGGIIWNTQGSGKSLIMVWLANWALEHEQRVVIITDREELDKQIAGLFDNVGVNITRAKDCAHLRELLASPQHSVICTLIHKYGHGSDIEDFSRELSAGSCEAVGNITAFIDECHRSNSGILHDAVRHLMPNAVLIGFTGTPLLKTDKRTSIETFGTFIHTYKFDEGLKDGVIIPLRYEARNVEQSLSDREAIDYEFDRRTEGLTEKLKDDLKRRWATLGKLYSSRERLERIAGDIITDFDTLPRLAGGRGTAILAAGSVYEACRYWEIFTSHGFTKCAVITSYDPDSKEARASTSDLSVESEEDCKRRVYDAMLNGRKQSDFERDALRKFKNDPANMKLLIVVDRLLTGFDAPSATYLYIDKSMRNHELFQAVCRVNRPDGDDKTHGCIIDYMDLFRSIQSAVNDYTSEAFDGYDRADVEELLTNRYDKAKCDMESSLSSLRDILSNVKPPRSDSDVLEYFCGESMTETRDKFYRLVSLLARSFGECCGRLVSHYGYSRQEVNRIREEIHRYACLKEIVRLNAGEKIGRAYDAYMREILDAYVKAGDSQVIGVVDEITSEDTMTLLDGLTNDYAARAAVIENNIAREIIIRAPGSPKLYGRLSSELERLILKRKSETVDYEEYMHQLRELLREVSAEHDAASALVDYFDGDVLTAQRINDAVRSSLSPRWQDNAQKKQDIQRAVYTCLIDEAFTKEEAERMTHDIFSIIQHQPEYNCSYE